MKFGIAFAHAGPAAERDYALGFARLAEACGFESLWSAEHVVVPGSYESAYPYAPTGRMPAGDDAPLPDPIAWLAFVAAATERIRLATGLAILPLHHPLVLAKRVATVDRLSGGRVILGIGMGWLREEFEALGVPWTGRTARAEESVAVMRALWREQRASHHGAVYDFDGLISEPKPARPCGVPVVVGGHSEAAARRAGRIGDGFFPTGLPLEETQRLAAVARRTAEEAGRDPAALEVTTVGPWEPDAAARHADAGIDRMLVIRRRGDLDRQRQILEEYRERVISRWEAR